jgi:hypothetical protein
MHCMNTKAEFSSVKTSGTNHNTARIKILITSNYALWHIINDMGPETVSFGNCLLKRCHTSDDINLRQHRCETLKSGVMVWLLLWISMYMEVISRSLFRVRLIIAGSVWGTKYNYRNYHHDSLSPALYLKLLILTKILQRLVSKFRNRN